MSEQKYQYEMLKRNYFDYLKESKSFSESSISAHENAIYLWEDFNKGNDYTLFNKKKAKLYKEWLTTKPKKNCNKKVSLSYCYHNLQRLQQFFQWLAKQPKYKSKINQTDIDFLNLSNKDKRIALSYKKTKVPTLEAVKKVIENIKVKNEIDQRDRALISFTLITGARISAIISLPLESFDETDLTIEQNPKLGVNTKFSKTIKTTLFPLSYENPQKYFLNWIKYLKEEKNFKQTDPIFPATKLENGTDNICYYNTGKIEPVFWQNSSSARKIFEKRFLEAGVPYYHPHTLRHLIVKELIKVPLTEEEKKAISQNLGHADVSTTFGTYGYGSIDENKQIDLVRKIDFNGKKQKIIYQLDEAEITKLLKKQSV